MKVTDFIICDDVRIEQLNKVSLMGIYNERIAITVPDKAAAKWPFVMSLGLYIRLDSAPDKMPPTFDFVIDFIMNDKKLAGIEGVANSFADTLTAIPVKIPQFPLTGEGTLKFQLTTKKKTGEELFAFTKEISITLMQQNKEVIK